MIVSQGANSLWLLLEDNTALRLGSLQVIQALEMPIGEGLVGQRPQPLAGLKFGRVGRQEEQVQSFRHIQLLAGVPPGSIQHQQNAPGGTGSHRLGKVGQSQGENLNRDSG